VNADMGVSGDGAARLAPLERHEAPRRRQMLRRLVDQFLDAPALDQVFEPCPLPVGAVAVVDEHAHDRGRRGDHLRRLKQHSGVACETAMPGETAEQHAKIDALGDRSPWADPDRGKADIGGVLQHADASAAVERDIELARQAVHLAVVQNVMVERAGQRPRIDQLVRIDAGGGAAGQVADVVGARTARGKAELLDRLQDLDRVGGADLADLQIGAGRDVEVAGAETQGDVGKPCRLTGRQDAARQAQAEHERILVRRDIKEAVEFVTEDIEPLRKPARSGIGADLVPHVERALFAFRQFLGHQLATVGDCPILRRNMDRGRVGGARRGGPGDGSGHGLCRLVGHRDAAFSGNTGDKPFEVLLLVFGKGWFLRHRAWHRGAAIAATRQSPCQPRRSRSQPRRRVRHRYRNRTAAGTLHALLTNRW